MSEFKMGSLDHVHVYVPNRKVAAEWYARHMGFEIISELESWADDPMGPLTVSADNGKTGIALFERNFNKEWINVVAFQVTGESFLKFLRTADSSNYFDRNGRPIKAFEPVDHEFSYSIYFSDPYGNPYELTTHDHKVVGEGLFRR